MYTFHNSNLCRLKSNIINLGIDFLVTVVGNLRAGKTYVHVSIIFNISRKRSKNLDLWLQFWKDNSASPAICLKHPLVSFSIMQMASVVGQTGFQRVYLVSKILALQPISPRLHSMCCQYQPINSRIFCRRSKVQISSVNCQVTQHKGEMFLVCVFLCWLSRICQLLLLDNKSTCLLFFETQAGVCKHTDILLHHHLHEQTFN